jgi:hypothetical protein
MSNEIVIVPEGTKEVDCIPDNKDLECVQEDTQYYGEYVKKSTACPICSSPDHMRVNLARAKDLLPISEISKSINISIESINKHFRNHFIISKNCRKILNLKESDNQEATDLVDAVLGGNLDIYTGINGVLQSKVQRHNMIRERLRILSDRQENNIEEQIDTAELLQLHKASNDLEDSIAKTYQLLHKSVFSVSKSEITEAFLRFQLDMLNKMLNDIQAVFIEFEVVPEYKEVISALRISLAKKFNIMEDSILRSGGIIKDIYQSRHEGDNKDESTSKA